jgi:hypothetical protein
MRTVGAAIDFSVVLDAVADDTHPALGAFRRQHRDGTFETIELE